MRLHLVGIAVAAVALSTLTACGTSDPLAITCSQFMKKDSKAQLDLATRWGAPNRDNIGPGERIAGRAYKDDLLRYCPGHPDAKLSELTLQVGT